MLHHFIIILGLEIRELPKVQQAEENVISSIKSHWERLKFAAELDERMQTRYVTANNVLRREIAIQS